MESCHRFLEACCIIIEKIEIMRNKEENYEFAIRVLCHRNELTNDDVETWMRDPENLEILRDIALIRRVGIKIPEKWRQEDWMRIKRAIERKKKFMWYRSVVAASVIIVLGIWFFLSDNIDYHNLKENMIEETEIIPGESRARLVMANGNVVDLTDTNEEIVALGDGVILNDSMQGLSYRSMPIDSSCQKEVFNELQVPVGGFFRLELSDGTRVWLNADTELRYPVRFVGNERNVYLRGEAYFEVAKDVERPFHVFVGKSEIRVLGTSFNVCAYPEERVITTTLIEGSVGFRGVYDGDEIKLEPGFQCQMDVRSGSISTKQVDVSISTAWVNGRFVFQFMNLESIMKQLERWYDFETIYLSPEIRNYEFRGVIERNSKIEDVFKAIELTTDVEFKIEGKVVKVIRRGNL